MAPTGVAALGHAPFVVLVIALGSLALCIAGLTVIARAGRWELRLLAAVVLVPATGVRSSSGGSPSATAAPRTLLNNACRPGL